MNRRQWIGSGVAAAVVLAGAGIVYETRPQDDDREILAAIAPVMLAGALPAGNDARDAVIRGFDIAVAGLPPSVQDEVAQLFGLLRNGLTRTLATGIAHPFHRASPDEIARLLTAWRYSRFAKLRSAYDALHQLCNAAWYGNPRSWDAIGYPGPPKVG